MTQVDQGIKTTRELLEKRVIELEILYTAAVEFNSDNRDLVRYDLEKAREKLSQISN